MNENGNLCVIGIFSPTDPGYAYVYTLSNTTWTLSQTLSASDGANGDNFGASIAMNPNANTIVISAPIATVSNIAEVGALYSFVNSNGTYTQTNKITPIDPIFQTRLGESNNLDITGLL